MRRDAVKVLATAACLVVLAAAPAWAMMIAPSPIPERVAQADVVVVGKVGKVEDKNVSALPLRGGKDKVEWQVVAFQIEENLQGLKKETKEIRVGFLPPQIPPMQPGVFVSGGGRRGVVLVTGQELCLFLVKHPTEDFYVPEMYFSVIDKKSPNAVTEIEATRRCVKLWSDPTAGLKSKDAEDRFLTAGMLISKYRTDRSGGKTKTEAVDAEQSKLILAALAEADWAPMNKNPTLFGFQMNPQALFLRLGLTDKDGWNTPKNIVEVTAAAKQWLKDNAGSYRIQKFVEATDK
jgi:hypothetical protein